MMKKLLLAVIIALLALTTTSHACSPELHCVLKYGATKFACATLAKSGSLEQFVRDQMAYNDDGSEADPGEYNNIPKIQAACKKIGIKLKK